MTSHHIIKAHRLLRQAEVGIGTEAIVRAPSNPRTPERAYHTAPEHVRTPLLYRSHTNNPAAELETGAENVTADRIRKSVAMELHGAIHHDIDGLYDEVVQNSPPFDAKEMLKGINEYANMLIRDRVEENTHRYKFKRWIGWPQTNKQGKEDDLCRYLNAVADSAREVLKIPQTPNDLVFSSEFKDSGPKTGHTTDRKPDLVVIPRWMKDKKNAKWEDFRAVVSLKIGNQGRTKENDQIMEYARVCLGAQVNRRYILGLGFLHNELSFYVFDRSGILATPHYNINRHREKFIEFAISILFMDDVQLGYDPSIALQGNVWFVGAGGKSYEILECLYVDRSLRGRGTVCFRVQDEKKDVFVVKDAWIDRTRKEIEVDYLKELKDSGIENVPTIVSHEIVPLPSDATERDSTENFRKKLILEELNSKDRTEAFSMFRGTELRDHYRIVQGPYGELLDDFDSLPELLSATWDILNVIDELDRIGIIHRDISLNNIILVDNHPSPYRKGYLIDYDYATRKDGTGEAAKGKRTGTLIFMAIDILRRKADHSPLHDAESMLYCLLCLCCTQEGPHYSKRTDGFNIKTSFLGRWCPIEDISDKSLHTIAESKGFLMNKAEDFEGEIISTIHPYFKPLQNCFKRMRVTLFPPPKSPNSDDELASASDEEPTTPEPDANVRSSQLVLGKLKKIIFSYFEKLKKKEQKARAKQREASNLIADNGVGADLERQTCPTSQGLTDNDASRTANSDASPNVYRDPRRMNAMNLREALVHTTGRSGMDLQPSPEILTTDCPPAENSPSTATVLEHSGSPSPGTSVSNNSPTLMLGKRSRETVLDQISGEGDRAARPAKQRILFSWKEEARQSGFPKRFTSPEFLSDSQ